MTITVYANTTDYNELPTGTFNMTANEYIKQNHVDSVAHNPDGTQTLFVEWGNGEGSDTYTLTVIDDGIHSFYMLDDDNYANEVQFVATMDDVNKQWSEYQTEFDLSENGYNQFVYAWDLIDEDEVIVNREAFERYIERGVIYDERIVAFIQSVFNTWDELNAIMTAAEVVEKFNLSESTVRVAISRDQIKARKSGGTWLLRREDVIKKWGNSNE